MSNEILVSFTFDYNLPIHPDNPLICQWEKALDLFDDMKYKNMPVTVVSYGKKPQWQE
jgi:hypothetical protein